MNEEVRELSSWFKDIQKKVYEDSVGYPEQEIYGKNVHGIFSYTPNFKGESPEYFVRNIDKELELYTLIEATQTIGINDILKGIFTSELLPKNRTMLDSLQFSNVQNGLVCYVQPRINEDGALLVNNLIIETNVKDGISSDLLIIIAKTGSRLNIEHEFQEGRDNSLLARKIIIVCEDGAMVHFKENINNVKGALSLDYIFLVGPESNITFVNSAVAQIILRQNVSSYLLGSGSNSSIEGIYILKDDSKYDVMCASYLKSESAHSIINTGAVVYDLSHLIYRSGIVSDKDNNGSVDEGKLLLVGDNSKIDTLPIKEANLIRQVSESHLNTADKIAVEKFLNRVVRKEHIDDVLNKIK